MRDKLTWPLRLEYRIGVSGALISMIERGERTLTLDVAFKIAAHYRVTVERLIRREYQPKRTSSPSATFTLATAKEMLTEFFPIVVTSDAMSNKDFKTAYGLHKAFISGMLTPEDPPKSAIAYCVRLYFDAWDHANIVEAAANLLGLLIITGATKSDMDAETAQQALLKTKGFDLRILGNYFLRTPENTIDNKTQKKAFIDDAWEDIIEFITALKKSENRQALGDYYLALCYFLELSKEI